MKKLQGDLMIEATLLISVVSGIGYIAFELLGWHVILTLGVVLLSAAGLIRRRWHSIRQKGLISYCSPRLRAALLERSLLDVFRDMVYFPYVTKIIGVFLHIAAAKPDPQEVPNLFKELPKEVSEAVNAKGLLSLAPAAVENLILPQIGRELVPRQYGSFDESWDHKSRYDESHEQVHEQTMEKRVIHFLDGKLGWPTAAALTMITVVGATHMNPKKFKKMLIQNATFCCMLFAAVALLIKIKKAVRKQREIKRPLIVAIQAEKKDL